MFNLDFSNVKDSQTFAPIPAGTYNVCVDEAEVRPTKKGDGEFVNVKLRVIDGPQANRFLFQNFNIKNPNPQAVEIGMQQLKSLMKCSGMKEMKLTSVLDLVGLMCQAVVKIKIDEKYSPEGQAVVSYFKPKAETGAMADNKPVLTDIPF